MASISPIRVPNITALWNFGLSAFSIAGAYYTVPHLLLGEEGGLLTRGFYASVCVHGGSYGCGRLGFFVALFIYSKFAELVDTLLLLLRKAPVIPLHWYHHATVLLYCWHSYAARIGTGLWYAAMNYSVHAIMYFYFGLTQCGPTAKRYAKRVSMLITLLQLSQMVVGITVTVSSLVYHARGDVCYVPAANSVMGLTMYASYFALFFVLFKSLYLTKKEKLAKAEREEALRKKRREEERRRRGRRRKGRKRRRKMPRGDAKLVNGTTCARRSLKGVGSGMSPAAMGSGCTGGREERKKASAKRRRNTHEWTPLTGSTPICI